MTSRCLSNANNNNDGITWQQFSMSLKWFVLIVRVIFLPVKTLFSWGSCLILNPPFFFHKTSPKQTNKPTQETPPNTVPSLQPLSSPPPPHQIGTSSHQRTQGNCPYDPKLWRDTRGLYPHRPVKQINSVNLQKRNIWCWGPTSWPCSTGKRSWLPLRAAVHWLSCWGTSGHLMSFSTCSPRLLWNAEGGTGNGGNPDICFKSAITALNETVMHSHPHRQGEHHDWGSLTRLTRHQRCFTWAKPLGSSPLHTHITKLSYTDRHDVRAALLSFSSAVKLGGCITSTSKTWQSFIKVNSVYPRLNIWIFTQQKEKAESFLVKIMWNATVRRIYYRKHTT